MDIKDFVKRENREKLAKEFTKEGLFELKEETIRGNKYHVFANLPQTLRDYFQFPLIHGEWDFLAYEDESYTYQEVLNNSAGLAHTLMDKYGIKKGDKVGYDGKWTAKKDSIIGILPVGYADGYPSLMGNNGFVLVNGKKAKVIGKVSMDLTAVDLSNFKDINYEADVVLWGRDLPVEKIAKLTKNIPYSIMTSLSARVKRIYL